MPDYKKMYHRLFNVQTDVIETLQQAHRETEEMYISAPEPEVRVIEPGKPDETKKD